MQRATSTFIKNFALAVKETINYSIKNLFLFEVKLRNTCVAFTSVFPFGIYYHFNDNNKIKILTILHTSKSQL